MESGGCPVVPAALFSRQEADPFSARCPSPGAMHLARQGRTGRAVGAM